MVNICLCGGKCFEGDPVVVRPRGWSEFELCICEHVAIQDILRVYFNVYSIICGIISHNIVHWCSLKCIIRQKLRI